MRFGIGSHSKREIRQGKRIIRGIKNGLSMDMEDHLPKQCAGPYRIAFIAYNAQLTRTYLRELADLNGGTLRGQWVRLEDGTEIIPIINPRFLDGHRFDQVIVADDSRKLIFLNQDFWEKMTAIKSHPSKKIPEEFFMQIYDLDAPVSYGAERSSR